MEPRFESLLGLVRHSGNAALLQAVEMSILSTLAGQPLHLHAEGLRGTGKTTILRGAQRLLPRIRRIQGCPYNCDPGAPHCPRHRDLDPEAVAALGTEWIPMPFLEISHSAKVGTVVGSIDLGRLVDAEKPEAALLPGTLPRAHRGIVFVDEINRLAETAPELADVLLDVMGTKPGRVQIEETGLPGVELSVSISVWAASNPDEDPGPLEEIRRQLSDRFDFVIPTGRPGEAEVVAEILAHFEGTLALGGAPATAQAARLEAYRTRMAARPARLQEVAVPPWVRRQVAEIYARFGLESLRAAQAILWGVRLSACLGDRKEAAGEDLLAVAPLALQHRVDGETLGRILQYLRTLRGPGEGSGASGSAGPGGPGAAAAALARAEAGGRPAAPGVLAGSGPTRPGPGLAPGAARPRAGATPGQGEGGLAPPGSFLQPAAQGTAGLAPGAGWNGAGPGGAAGASPGAGTGGAGPAGSGRGAAGGGLGLSGPHTGGHGPGVQGLGQGSGPGPASPGPGGGHRDGRPFWERVKAALRGSGRGGGPVAGAAAGARGPGREEGLRDGDGRPLRPASPEAVPPQAPPHPARPLGTLGPGELVRTQAELGGDYGP